MADFTVDYLIELRDKFSANASKMGRASNKFKSSLSKLVVSLKKAGSKLKSFGQTANKVGKDLSLKLTAPLVALGYLAVRSFGKQAAALGQVRQGIKSTGGAAQRTLKQLENQARSLQKNTIFGDETILQAVTSQLLTFTNIADKAFDKTQQAVVDVTSKLYGLNASEESLRATSIMLGKALNDPVANLGALGRAGIQFSEKQKDLIKALAQSGKLAAAQSMILKELKNQYGGAAKVLATEGIGAFKQLANILGDMLEPFGKILVDILLPLVPKVTALAEKFNKLSPSMKKIIVISLAIVAAIGPLLLIFAAVTTAITILASPIGLIVIKIALIIAAVAALIAILKLAVKGWVLIFKVLGMGFKSAWDWLNKIGSKIGEIGQKIAKSGIGKIGAIGGKIGSKIGEAGSAAGRFFGGGTDTSTSIEEIGGGETGGSINGLIKVQAEQGTKVTEMQNKSKGVNVNMAANVAGAA